jgi:hypothetical protein
MTKGGTFSKNTKKNIWAKMNSTFYPSSFPFKLNGPKMPTALCKICWQKI